MNGPKGSPRYQTIKLRSINTRVSKRKSSLITQITSKGDKSIIRQNLLNDYQSPKFLQSSRHSINNYLPILSEKDSLNSSMNSINNTTFKLNESLNRSQISQNHVTPNSYTSITEQNDNLVPKEYPKSVRLVHRNSVSNEKSNSKSILDPDSLLLSQKLPLKPASVFKQFLSYLTKYEQAEILDYPDIYFLGMNSLKIRGDIKEENFGFDDDRSDYKLTPGDHLAYRYEIQQILGKGSFGQVCKCYDHKNKQQVAIKIIRNQKRFHRQGKIEVKVLKQMKSNDPESQSHAIQIKEYFLFRKHICISFELLSINLYELLKSNNYRGLSISLIRRFIVQIVACLSYMREQKIIHCDLKPENILLKESNKSGIKVIDFGSSCFDNEKIYTYIQSRFYRAPEIILGIDYGVAIDM